MATWIWIFLLIINEKILIGHVSLVNSLYIISLFTLQIICRFCRVDTKFILYSNMLSIFKFLSLIDLNDLSVYRDLQKPVGALNEERLTRLKVLWLYFKIWFVNGYSCSYINIFWISKLFCNNLFFRNVTMKWVSQNFYMDLIIQLQGLFSTTLLEKVSYSYLTTLL